jgi:apolipoprotein N-acyltransferase
VQIVLSALLLVIAYPQIEFSGLAWIAFVPLFFILDHSTYKKSFGWAYGYGLVFFAGTLGWFIYVTYPGAAVLIAYLAVYFGLFGLAFKYFSKLPLMGRVFLLPAVWACLEFARNFVFTGFGWAMLGHSQYKNTLLIQIADITGVYGVSFLVMLVNVLIFESVRIVRSKSADTAKLRQVQIVAAAVVLSALGYGAWQATHVPPMQTVNIGVVQPNIPQAIKWNPQMQFFIVQKTIHLSEEFKGQKLDLIVWPETSLPGIVSEIPHLMEDVKKTARRLKTPLLMGTVTEENGKFYNSTYLLSPKGAIAGRYDKIHLVPFGEYLPLRPVLGWINQFVPLEDFTSGTEYKLFKTDTICKPFSVLICFEDTLGYLRRNFTNEGTGFFINVTNDAWFMDTKAPFMHLQPAVFGCVANKRSLVRAANTGFSGFIDPYGRIISTVHDETNKKTFVAGVASAQVPISTIKTFYTKYGDVFTALCLFAILFALAKRRRYA